MRKENRVSDYPLPGSCSAGTLMVCMRRYGPGTAPVRGVPCVAASVEQARVVTLNVLQTSHF